jgi:hypothetical protein
MTDETRLRQMLLEDADSEELAEAVFPLVQQINALSMPEPQKHPTASLISQLRAELPTRTSWHERLLEWYPLLILRSQVRVVSGEIWLASLVVMACGTLVTIAAYEPGSGTWFALLAPTISAIGVALLYDSGYERYMELEDASTLGVSLLLLARLTLVYSFNLLLGLLGSLALALIRTELSLLPLVLSWLLPMTLLSALAFFLSIATRSALFSALTSLIAWAAFNRTSVDSALWSASSLGGLTLLIAAVLVAAGLWFAGQSERRLGASI